MDQSTLVTLGLRILGSSSKVSVHASVLWYYNDNIVSSITIAVEHLKALHNFIQ